MKKTTKKVSAKNPGDMFNKFQFKKKNWIAGAIKKPGALHKELRVPAGKKIPAKKLAKATKAGGIEAKRANLAKTLKSFSKKKMTQKQDDAYDKKNNQKEGSKKDIAQDKKYGIKDKKSCRAKKSK